MLHSAISRLASALSMLFVVATLVFAIQVVIPGDPAELLLSSAGSTPTPENIAALRVEMGLDRPLLQQYVEFLWGAVRLDFGNSLIDNSSIGQTIATRLPRTLELIAVAMSIAVAVAVPFGTHAALRAGGRLDTAGSGVSALFAAVPVFVIGTLLILLFAQTLKLTPAGGYADFGSAPIQHLSNLVLPAITVAMSIFPIIFRMTRSSVLDSLSNEWVRTALAKGLPRRAVVRRHVLRNALGPVVTVIGLQLGILLGSTVLVEFVFNWPGLSGYLVTAVEQRDYPTVRAIILVVAAIFIFINLLIELLQMKLDPRVQL
ncbi:MULTISPECIES: ABC transporter permease [Chelativorans]|jgi:peptide/nickel transport system permease protein|uniref:Binding-protein-dependent transport systems inner membrane component n=1 Tax=Chelativorans sp. (strain BNC1) TaxID=266779 RepID=Q11M95_CHESB|nr:MULTISPECIES: ABC transporter permease [Chelativorans]